jgi:phi13 family phage major tail protein
MAAVGMKNLTFAQVATESSTAITYTGGVVAEHARTGDITYERDESDYYGDDMKVDAINEVTGYTAKLEMTNIDPEILTLLGMEEDITEGTGTSATHTYELAAGAGVPVGFGFIQTLRIDGEYTYRAYWFYKCTFAPDSMSAKTKEKNIEWNSPSMSGKGWGVYADSTGKVRYRKF